MGFVLSLVGDLVVKVLCKMEDMKNPLPVHDKYQGTYLLMVHPNEMVYLDINLFLRLL